MPAFDEDALRDIAERAADDFRGASPKEPGERVTLDANLLHDYWKDRPRRWAVERLLDLAAAAEIDLAVTRYIREDIPHGPLRDRLDELHTLQISETGGVFTLGVSALGGSDGLGSDAFLRFEELVVGENWQPSRGKPPDRRDWNHLHAHYIQRRDAFFTWDEGILELAEPLNRVFGMEVVRPDAYLQRRAESA